MRLSNTIKLSISSLAAHPFRSFLAGLGVVFGVGTVVGMLAIGEGARLESIRKIEEVGVDRIILQSIPPEGNESSSGFSIGVNDNDSFHFKNKFDNIKAVLPITHWRGVATSQHVQEPNVHILGVPKEFLDLTNSNLKDSRSRFFRQSDYDESTPVCVIGSRIAKDLFGFRDPVGESLLLKGVYFEIVGVLDNPADREISSLTSVNNMVYIPSDTGFEWWQTPARRGSLIKYKLVYVVVDDVAQIENTARRMEAYMRSTHENDDYSIVLPFELMKQQEATQRIFTIVMASIASISLLVGGIGIMNIMMANIYERMKEIGTRRALGATSRDILTQFLVESVTLTASGGILGAILGVLLAALVSVYADMPTHVTGGSVVLSLSISVMTGVIFGSFPAWKASMLSPMEALRHD